MASGFWVVPMPDRFREISAFIIPFGLFEWSRMPFGLTNAPQIYQRFVDNALRCGNNNGRVPDRDRGRS
ncbi:reverse transcriptase [Phytophthora megakarya]|uniref:Reverse transcriptase n=1 Tax=Phytophthora megakarya TaxID=4795 RepID=A0A225V8N7_9STRA|nr:reverse transcriptase [Phytophthora megakarya]